MHKLLSLRRLRSEEGMTLVELTVSMSMLAIVSVIFLTALASVQRGVERQTDRSTTNDQARLAIEQLDHEIRSGNLLYNPSSESDPDPNHQVVPFMSLRIYTQANANARNPGNQCVQWRITDTDELQSRRWATTWRDDPATLVTSWRIVAENVVNRDINVQAFTLDPDPAKGGRTIVVNLVVNSNSKSGQNVTIKQSVTGRNTEYGYPSNVCADIPPY